MHTQVCLAAGRHGRHIHREKFRVIETCSGVTGRGPSRDYIMDILNAAEQAPPNDFSSEEKYLVSVVLLDTSHGVHFMRIPITPARTSPGFVIGRTKDILSEILSKTHNKLPEGDYDTTETKVYIAKFETSPAILVFPREVATVDLFNELGLVEHPVHKIMGVEVRLCCGGGLSKSKPLLSYCKFDFLFPGVVYERYTKKRKFEICT